MAYSGRIALERLERERERLEALIHNRADRLELMLRSIGAVTPACLAHIFPPENGSATPRCNRCGAFQS